MVNTNAFTFPVSEATIADCEVSDIEPVIYAPVTPPGPAGVAIYRLSGMDLSAVCTALGLPKLLPARKAQLHALYNPLTGALIDQALILFFPGPHSYTGEHVLELHCHGGAAIRRSILEALSALPACRLAEPGEFSKRAFLNGKMDLLQAEAVADLICAETDTQHQLALSQLGGQMSDSFEQLRLSLLRALALLEAYIDFPDEDIPEQTLTEINDLTRSTFTRVTEMLEEPPSGELIRDGVSVAIVGPTNAGKSSLMNALAQRDIAIVSEIAGTTRDRIETHLNLNGYLVKLIDTAGIRDTEDLIESEGVRRSHDAIKKAQIVIAIFDIITYPELDAEILALLPEHSLIVLNKHDLLGQSVTDLENNEDYLLLSLKNQWGLDLLVEHLQKAVERQMQTCTTPSLTRVRHRQALQEASTLLSQIHLDNPLELSAEELRLAARAIGKITGKIEVDQLLDVIFREFCIGK